MNWKYSPNTSYEDKVEQPIRVYSCCCPNTNTLTNANAILARKAPEKKTELSQTSRDSLRREGGREGGRKGGRREEGGGGFKIKRVWLT